jgi:ElaB/YqjD/DUF883 family membrane-anchored ribosome-binding protein
MSITSIASGREALSSAIGEAKSKAGDVAQSLSGALSRGGEQLDAGREAVTSYARANPMRTIGVAALIGVALGVLFFRSQE